ncbi:hypothetical protein HHI36_014644 [Cryptolaemus montrouzieri]|uniref:PiggyBac transposable element-derived protein domain-containing protein n=1 Tax=Cryptolaemus montrouzieri TaxID=559131 RepID=A0ABD2N3D4_9CUCU
MSSDELFHFIDGISEQQAENSESDGDSDGEEAALTIHSSRLTRNIDSPSTSTGKFFPYAGAKSGFMSDLGLGDYVVMKLLSVVKEQKKHTLYFDRFSSSHQLFRTLTDNGFSASGTVRGNCLKECSLQPDSELKEKPRGAYDSE